jgi:hypothetical protein
MKRLTVLSWNRNGTAEKFNVEPKLKKSFFLNRDLYFALDFNERKNSNRHFEDPVSIYDHRKHEVVCWTTIKNPPEMSLIKTY